MPNKKKPVAVLKAEGCRHYTKAELEQRSDQEVKAPEGKILPPKYLSGSLITQFNNMAPILEKMGVLSSVDADVLARYLLARQQYVSATNFLNAALKAGNVATADKWSAIQDRFFKQCRACGEDLGLSVSARANLLIPAAYNPEPLSSEEADMFGE